MREPRDFGPDERWNHGKEDLLLEGRHSKHARCLAPDSLHWYWRRRLLAPGDAKANAILFRAGTCFGDDFQRCQLNPCVTAPYCDWIASFDGVGLAGQRLAAYRRWRKACIAAGGLVDTLISVACFGQFVGKPKIKVLRRGLGILAQHYGF